MIRTVLAACVVLSGCIEPPPPLRITATEQASGTTALLIAVSPVNDSVVWASGAGGTHVRTTDGGATWIPGTVPGVEYLEFRDVHGADATTAYLMSAGAADSSRVYATRDGGATWTLQLTNPDSTGFFNCMGFWDAARGLLLGDAVDGQLVVYATADSGANWNRIPAGRLPAALPNEVGLAASGTCLTTQPGGTAWFVTGRPLARIFHTADYGESWTVDTLPLSTAGSVSFRDASRGMVFGGESGPGTASTTDGGGTWVAGNVPPIERGIFAGVYVPGASSVAVVVASPGGLAWSSDDGFTWVAINFNNHWSVGFASPRAGWAVGAEGHITKLSGF